MNSSMSTDTSSLTQTVSGLMQSVSNLAEGLRRVQQLAEDAQRQARAGHAQPRPPPVRITLGPHFTSNALSEMQGQAVRGSSTVGTTSPARNEAISSSGLNVRKMDTKPPTFVGDIDGIKLNSFFIQFESYFRQKGYDLIHHDDKLAWKLNQCVQKNALVWYERYMTDISTNKLWSAKLEMSIEFMEPNFQEKIRNKLLTLKQTGGYIGYVAKFRELNRIVQVDSLTAMNLFLNGLSDSIMKQNILRKRPRDLNAAIQEGFLEWELKDKNLARYKSVNNRLNNKMGKMEIPQQADSGKQSFPTIRRSNYGGKTTSNSSKSVEICSFCGRGPHRVEDCWVKFPEKHPIAKTKTEKKIFTMLERMTVGENQTSDEPQRLNE